MNWRKILAPFAAIWFIITQLRNLLYDVGVFYSKKYPKTIVVGNLTVGGTGKSPHTLYLLALLKDHFRTAVLSRGYGRRSSGFGIANYDSTTRQIGDEPMQAFNRFKNKIIVAVGEDRIRAVQEIQKRFRTDVVVLDDAFQHRRLKAGLYILLTRYDQPYNSDYLLPVGNLRESSINAKRAEIVVVTKCPEDVNDEEKARVEKKLKLNRNQHLFFSHIKYANYLIGRRESPSVEGLKDYNVLLVTGIADASHLSKHIHSCFTQIEHLKFPDHYNFKEKDIEQIKKAYDSMSEPKMILTTEKDYMRLKYEYLLLDDLYYLPIEVEIDQQDKFNQLIINHVRNHQTNY